MKVYMAGEEEEEEKKEEEEGLNEGVVVCMWLWNRERGIAGEEGTFFTKAEEGVGVKQEGPLEKFELDVLEYALLAASKLN
ncbi:hypothetical protein AAES_53171 [Amazona aestiva]|uniref:Uncharacterized protein n=1 Tax=Amazona aestiva TaxID=12930 RepID=A0A0Q3UTJ7_AMAAE|nr:hypothetical protein AAES_53171 [Amazona aestiva]